LSSAFRKYIHIDILLLPLGCGGGFSLFQTKMIDFFLGNLWTDLSEIFYTCSTKYTTPTSVTQLGKFGKKFHEKTLKFGKKSLCHLLGDRVSQSSLHGFF
jgi:hypothetical protein